MKLVIAEKPSVAMSLAAVLGATERKDGYLEGSGYLVSWCVGHLLELAQPAASLYFLYCLTAKCSGSFSSRRSNMRSTGFLKSSSSSRASDAFIISSSVVKFFSSSGASYQI